MFIEKLRPLFVLALALCLWAGPARAVILYDTVRLVRASGQTGAAGSLRFMVDEPGASGPRFLYVKVGLRIAGEAAIAPGQTESFRATAYLLSGGTGTVHHVRVVLKPLATIHTYPTVARTLVVVSPLQGSLTFTVKPQPASPHPAPSPSRGRRFEVLYGLED